MKHTCKTNGMANCEPCIEWRVELWDEIDALIRHCGGKPNLPTSVARQVSVSRIESIIVKACNDDKVR